jgi:hypothetical protein
MQNNIKYSSSENIKNIISIVDKLICKFKQTFGNDIFRFWFRSIDLEETTYLRIYYFLLSMSKNDITIKTNDIYTFIKPYCYERIDLLKEFNKRIGPFVTKTSDLNVKKFYNSNKNLVLILGGNQEIALISAIKKYVKSNKNIILYSQIKRIITNRSAQPPKDIIVLFKKKNKLLSKKIDRTLLNSYEDIRTASLQTASKKTFKEHRTRWYEITKKSESLFEHEKVLTALVLDHFLVVLSLTYIISGIFLKFNPVGIIGAFEKSAFGTLLYDFSRSKKIVNPCKILNVQHGLISESAMLSKVKFDRFFIWDKATFEIINTIGYRSMKNVKIIGNEFWDNLKRPLEKWFEFSGIEMLKQWKGKNQLILACSQPLALKYQEEFKMYLYSYVETHPNIKLLVRLHPSQQVDTIKEWQKCLSNTLSGKVKITQSHDFDLSTCIVCSDIVCSDYSTVLIDAYHANKLVLSISKEIAENSLIYKYFTTLGIPIAHNKFETHSLLSKLLNVKASTRFNSNSVTSNFQNSVIRQLQRTL